METFAAIAEKTRLEDQKDVILKHAQMVDRAGENLEEPHDRKELQKRYHLVLTKLSRNT